MVVPELHPLGRQAVDVGGLVVPAAETGDVGIPEVVGEDENDVRLLRIGGRERAGRADGHKGRGQHEERANQADLLGRMTSSLPGGGRRQEVD